MESFPVLKLSILVFKQLSKPISNVIKDHAKDSLYFRQYVAMPPANFYNWMEVKIRLWSLNMGKSTTIPQLNEGMAIDLGAKLLGEIILFSVPAAVLVFEYLRQARKEKMKQEELLLEKLELVNTVNIMSLHLERQDVQLKRIKKSLAIFDSYKHKNKNNDQFEETPLQLKKLPIPGQ